MRRISASQATPGMILLRSIYDSRGYIIFKEGSRLSQESLKKLNIYGVAELVIEDRRVSDIPVQQLIAPELEAEAVQALRQLLTEHQGNTRIDPVLLDELENVGSQMTRDLFPEVIGEVNTSGCASVEDYQYIQPVKVVGLALLLGKRMGYDMIQLNSLVMAALLKDVGHSASQNGSEADPKMHALYGAEIISGYQRFRPEVAEAVFQHHERWDGSGYPEGISGKESSTFARILAIADAFYELVSVQPDKAALMPHEAIEYIMAYSGEMFDPELVQVFASNVPLYPAGVLVRLNTGESGVVSRNNPGQASRPAIRVFFNKRGRPRLKPFDMNLAESEYQNTLVVEVIN
ncbi:MAG: HD domain-containing protein [Chloroflexi bacterium]|nr:HD domain-containing protein [Chloroflexota bacterium]